MTSSINSTLSQVPSHQAYKNYGKKLGEGKPAIRLRERIGLNGYIQHFGTNPEIMKRIIHLDLKEQKEEELFPIFGYQGCEDPNDSLYYLSYLHRVFKLISGLPLLSFVPGMIEFSAIVWEADCNRKWQHVARGLLAMGTITAPLILVLDTMASEENIRRYLRL